MKSLPTPLFLKKNNFYLRQNATKPKIIFHLNKYNQSYSQHFMTFKTMDYVLYSLCLVIWWIQIWFFIHINLFRLDISLRHVSFIFMYSEFYAQQDVISNRFSCIFKNFRNILNIINTLLGNILTLRMLVFIKYVLLNKIQGSSIHYKWNIAYFVVLACVHGSILFFRFQIVTSSICVIFNFLIFDKKIVQLNL